MTRIICQNEFSDIVFEHVNRASCLLNRYLSLTKGYVQGGFQKNPLRWLPLEIFPTMYMLTLFQAPKVLLIGVSHTGTVEIFIIFPEK